MERHCPPSTKAEFVTSDISRIFTGAPTDRSIWMMVGGV
ncbi:DUF3185 family protein [Undibacterium arcticum]